MGSLAGLAAGLGLAALLSHFGLGEGLADLLMILIVVAAAIFALGMLFRKRPLESDPMSEPMQYAGIGGPSMGPPGDAIALSSSGTSSTRASVAAINRAIPADFDQDGFLRVAKLNFIRRRQPTMPAISTTSANSRRLKCLPRSGWTSPTAKGRRKPPTS